MRKKEEIGLPLKDYVAKETTRFRPVFSLSSPTPTPRSGTGSPVDGE